MRAFNTTIWINSLEPDYVRDIMQLLHETEPGSRTELIINCTGGALYDTLGLYDFMRVLRKDRTIAGRVFGVCQSATPLILAACSRGHRTCGRNATFMVHWSHTDEISGSPDAVVAVGMQLRAIDAKWSCAMDAETHQPPGTWADMNSITSDLYFDAETAKRFGLVDFIV